MYKQVILAYIIKGNIELCRVLFRSMFTLNGHVTGKMTSMFTVKDQWVK